LGRVLREGSHGGLAFVARLVDHLPAPLKLMEGFRNILVATDFSPAAESSLKQGDWLAGVSGARLTLVHTLPDLRYVVHYRSALVDLLRADPHEFCKTK
jgi:hypothetical protein